jgi:elongation factor G
MYADDATEIQSIPTGHIGVIVGLKHVRTGDTLISEADSKHHHHAPKHKGKKKKLGKTTPHSTLQLKPIDVPPPVFFASIEPASLSEQKSVEEALAILLREDPSLHITVDEESGQTLISGMGELHLEIARDRLVKDLKARAEMGSIQIGYRESIVYPLVEPIHKVYSRELAGKILKAGVQANVFPSESAPTPPSYSASEVISLGGDNFLTLTIASPTPPETPKHHQHHAGPPPECPPVEDILPTTLPYDLLRGALISGTEAALARGPRLSYPMQSTHVHLIFNPATDFYGPNESTHAAITSAARAAIVAAFKQAEANNGTAIMEPVMNVSITVPESDLGKVINDISSHRGGFVLGFEEEEGAYSRIDNTNPISIEGTELSIPSIMKGDRISPNFYIPPDFDTRSDKTDLSNGISGRDEMKIVKAKVPLAEMVGYLKHLRSATQGRGTFVMAVENFERVSGNRLNAILDAGKW